HALAETPLQRAPLVVGPEGAATVVAELHAHVAAHRLLVGRHLDEGAPQFFLARFTAHQEARDLHEVLAIDVDLPVGAAGVLAVGADAAELGHEPQRTRGHLTESLLPLPVKTRSISPGATLE